MPSPSIILVSVVVLTTPDGSPIWIETQHIQTIRPEHYHAHGSCPQGANAIIRFDSGSTLCIRESPDQINKMTK